MLWEYRWLYRLELEDTFKEKRFVNASVASIINHLLGNYSRRDCFHDDGMTPVDQAISLLQVTSSVKYDAYTSHLASLSEHIYQVYRSTKSKSYLCKWTNANFKKWMKMKHISANHKPATELFCHNRCGYMEMTVLWVRSYWLPCGVLKSAGAADNLVAIELSTIE